MDFSADRKIRRFGTPGSTSLHRFRLPQFSGTIKSAHCIHSINRKYKSLIIVFSISMGTRVLRMGGHPMISIDQGVSCCGWCQFGTCLNLSFIKTTAGKIKLAEIVSTLPGIINRTLAAFALNPVCLFLFGCI